MIRCTVFFALAIATSAIAETSKPDIHKSLVRITTTSQDPDYRVPWNPGNITVGIGAGFVIDGNRILTNAHVVSNGRLIVVEKENDPKEYIGKVEFIGSDCDLAVVRVQDSNFYKGTAPVHFDDLIHLGSFAKAREAGKLRIEGKEYVVKDGDVMEFRFNV